MQGVNSMLKMNLKRRMTDGFALGYNIIFPLLLTGILGVLLKGRFPADITSYQYYAVVMIPFCTCMGIITVAFSGKDDAYAKTAERVMTAPVSKGAIVASKVATGTIVLSGCAFFVYGISRILFNLPANGIVLLLFFYVALSFAISGLGTYVGLSMKNFMVIKNIMSVPICLAGLAAGVFFRTGTLNQALSLLLNCSPLTWVNRAIFLRLYDGHGRMLIVISAACIGIGMAATVGAVLGFKKEEYIYGCLPGYEK